jgi:hypothetical protein
MTARAINAPMKSVCIGTECVGFIYSRGKLGVEAFDREQRSLGVFETTAGAAVRGAAQNEVDAGR